MIEAFGCLDLFSPVQYFHPQCICCCSNTYQIHQRSSRVSVLLKKNVKLRDKDRHVNH